MGLFAFGRLGSRAEHALRRAFAVSHLTVLCGPTGCGKTRHAKALVARSPRLLVIDPAADYPGEGVPFSCGVEWGLERCLERIVAFKAHRLPRFRLSCRVRGQDAEEVLRAVWMFNDDYERPRPSLVLVVDEAHKLSKPGDKETPFDWLCTEGRRVCTQMIVCTQRLARISRDATSNARSIVMWHCTEPSVLEDLQKRRGPEAVEAVRRLRPSEPQRAGECLAL